MWCAAGHPFLDRGVILGHPLGVWRPQSLIGISLRNGIILCPLFSQEDSEVAEAGRNLEVCFEDMLKETYPGRAFPFPQDDDSETEEIGADNCPLNLKNFHWPNYGQDCVQPKRRRRHPMSQKSRDFNLC